MRYQEIMTADGLRKVSKLVIGSAVKMGALDKSSLFDLFDRYLDAGGNCIDTARAYGGGNAEEMIGEYLKLRGNRGKVLLSSKCGHPDSSGHPRLKREDLLDDLDKSLTALRVDHIDLYWLHKDDESIPVESIVDGMNDVLQTGKVGAIGCSNWHTDRIERANEYAARTGKQGFALSQIQWNLCVTKEEYFRRYTTVVMDEASYAWYRKNGMTVFAFSPQAQGFFSKLEQGGAAALSDMLRRCYENPENLERFRRAQQIARERNVPISVPVLAYLTNNPLPAVAVFGATGTEMLEETMLAGDFVLTPEEITFLNHGGV